MSRQSVSRISRMQQSEPRRHRAKAKAKTKAKAKAKVKADAKVNKPQQRAASTTLARSTPIYVLASSIQRGKRIIQVKHHPTAKVLVQLKRPAGTQDAELAVGAKLLKMHASNSSRNIVTSSPSSSTK